MCLNILFVKLFKSVVFSYIVRKGLKESDDFVSRRGHRDSCFWLCPICGNNNPATLSRMDTIRPFCPACTTKLSSSNKININENRNNLDYLEQLDYIF